MDEMRFDQEVALVTGVSEFGLGRAYAEMLADRGCRIVVNDLGRDWGGGAAPPGAEQVAASITEAGGEAVAVLGDVVHEADRIVGAALDAYGRLDAVVNNAGAGGDFTTQVDAHLNGAHRISEAARSHLERSGGRILNVASGAVFGSPAMPGYGAAKGGILALTRTQSILGAASGVRANAVLPSAWTRSTAGIAAPGFGDFMAARFPAGAVAAFAVYLLHRTTEVTGEAFAVGGGLATRVVLAETRGAAADTPEEWAARIGAVLDDADLSTSPSMWAQLDAFIRRMGPDVYAEWRAIGIPTDAAGRVEL